MFRYVQSLSIYTAEGFADLRGSNLYENLPVQSKMAIWR